MEAALRLARAASVREEVPVGAVVIAEGEVLGEAHNETIQRRDPTAHAELLALQRALQQSGEDRLLLATLYITLEPCAQCAGAIVLSKVGRVVFGAYDVALRNGGIGVRSAPKPPYQSPARGHRGIDGGGVWRPAEAVLPGETRRVNTGRRQRPVCESHQLPHLLTT